MATALNLTIPIKQDKETLANLRKLEADFATEIQPKIDAALRGSKIVHFARVVVCYDKYLQVLTEFDGDQKEYSDFFLRTLPDVFAKLFSLAELPADSPPFASLDADKFFKLAKSFQCRSLGKSTDETNGDQGYLFSAYDRRLVKDILPKLS